MAALTPSHSLRQGLLSAGLEQIKEAYSQRCRPDDVRRAPDLALNQQGWEGSEWRTPRRRYQEVIGCDSQLDFLATPRQVGGIKRQALQLDRRFEYALGGLPK